MLRPLDAHRNPSRSCSGLPARALFLTTLCVGSPAVLALGHGSDLGDGEHGLVRTAVVTGDFGNLPAQTGVDGPQFGYSVALDGDWLAVGAPGAVIDSGGALGVGPFGTVFVFKRDAGGWDQRLVINIPSYGNAPRCGHSVALHLPNLTVGCPGAASSGAPGSPRGRFVNYRLSGDGQTFGAPVGYFGSGSDRCGTAVEVSADSTGGTAVLADGCPGWQNEQGRVRLFRFEAGGWLPEGSRTAGDGAAGDRFGESLALYRSTGPLIVQRLAVGAPYKSHAPAFAAGSVYLLGGPDWTAGASFTHPAPASFSLTYFGSALAMNNTQLVIGSPGGFTSACGSVPRCGLVQRYQREGADWQLQEGGGGVNMGGNPPGEQSGMDFGATVALGFDNWTAVAAPRADGWTQFNNLAEDIGMVELRRGADGAHGVSWSHHRGELDPGAIGALALAGGQFGTSADFGGRRLAVGYPRAGVQIGGRRGQVWVYETDVIFADGFQ